jgi:hypothetical protein
MLILDVTDVPLGRLISGLLRDDGATAITEAAVITLLGTASAITGQGPGATAAAADVLNGHVPVGVNQLIDHEFRFADTFWRRTSQSGSTTGATNETLGIRRRTITGSGVTVGHFIQLDSFPDRTRFACRAGDVIEASAFVSGSNLSAASVFLTFYNAANALIGFSAVNNFTPGSATASLADFVRGSIVATAPANTAMAFINVRGTASSSAPVMHVARPMLARANSLQTAPSAWNPGFNGTPGADPTAANQAASIAGQGSLATQNNVLASLLNLADPSNMVTDGDLRDSAAWATATGWTFGSTDADIPAQLNTPRAWKTPAGNGTTSQASNAVNFPQSASILPVEPGRPIRLAARVLAKAGFTGQIGILARFGDNAGNLISAPTFLGTNYRTTAAAIDAVQTISGVALPPANAAFVQFRISITWSTTQNNAGHAYVGAPFMQRAAQLGALVTLEDGTTIGTDALLRTALGTAAALAGQGALATLNAVDTAQIANGAVTQAVTDSTEDFVDLAADNVYEELAAVAVNVPANATVLLQGFAFHQALSNGGSALAPGYPEVGLRIRRRLAVEAPSAAVLVRFQSTSTAFNPVGSFTRASQGPGSITDTDDPAAGNYVYTLEGIIDLNWGGATSQTRRFGNRLLTAILLKK